MKDFLTDVVFRLAASANIGFFFSFPRKTCKMDKQKRNTRSNRFVLG